MLKLLKQKPLLLLINVLPLLFVIVWIFPTHHVNDVANKWVLCPLGGTLNGDYDPRPCISSYTQIPPDIQRTINEAPLYNELLYVGLGIALTVVCGDLLYVARAKRRDRVELAAILGLIYVPWITFLWSIVYVTNMRPSDGLAANILAAACSIVLGVIDLLLLRHAIKLAYKNHRLLWLGIDAMTLFAVVVASTLIVVVYARYL